MSKSGGSVSTGAAMRLVHTIGVIRWLFVTLIALGVGSVVIFAVVDGSSLGAGLSLFALLYGVVASVGVYVFLGWLQQTLLMLVGIAKNTAAGDLLGRF